MCVCILELEGQSTIIVSSSVHEKDFVVFSSPPPLSLAFFGKRLVAFPANDGEVTQNGEKSSAMIDGNSPKRRRSVVPSNGEIS